MMEHVWMRDYTYVLPDDRIASAPLQRRDAARLLVSRDGQIVHSRFSQLADFLDTNSTLYFNDTKVIPARLRFKKETGAVIEVLLLSPVTPPLTQLCMSSTGSCVWKCMIGNLKRWNEGATLYLPVGVTILEANLQDRDQGIVQFKWSAADATFASILQQAGDTPLPPYIQRATNENDKSRYQTVYAHYEGAVAAPTAGLHFTTEVLDSLHAKGIQTDFLTLHVSAGTFLPVKTDNALEHKMHEERISISKSNVLNLMNDKQVVAVGTTSMRTLESLYWFGCLLSKDPSAGFDILQELPYSPHVRQVALKESLQHVLGRIGNDTHLEGKTSIFIRPGYAFRVCDGLITNFHQPGSTLLLLIAAFAGPAWRVIYQEALEKGYRFLSYGDSSLILRGKPR